MTIRHICWHNKSLPRLKTGQVFKVRGGNVVYVAGTWGLVIEGPGFNEYGDVKMVMPTDKGEGDNEVLFIWNTLIDYAKDVLEMKS